MADGIIAEVGKDHIIHVAYDEISKPDADAFASKWTAAMKG